jgi:hypothetical protein
MSLAHVYTVAFEGWSRAKSMCSCISAKARAPAACSMSSASPTRRWANRVNARAALNAVGLALPYNRTTVNLAPADLPKEGSH